ncbi:MAG: DUF885 domain-containing protein [Vicinamibacterales bacterium]
MMTARGTALLLAVALLACTPRPQPVTVSTGDPAFRELAAQIIEDAFRRSPGFATYRGVHRYDDRLDDFSASAILEDVARARGFRQRLDMIDPAALSDEAKLDREVLLREMDSLVLELDVVRSWARDADSYTRVATDAVFSIMKRNFAPAADRLKLVIAREKQIPALLAQARVNLDNPPRVFTETAIEQNDGVQNFFRTDLPLAFADVTDRALLTEFRQANGAVLNALADYKRWLQTDLLPRSNGSFALGAQSYAALLSASNMIDAPLDVLLRIAETDRVTNERAFVEAADAVDRTRSTEEVLAIVAGRHPTPQALLSTTQNVLDSLRDFITAKNLVTIPPSAPPARVQETPPFMRTTSTASMDTPGPWETTASEAYFYMTRPDPRWKAAEQEAYMRGWYDQMILNVAVHEVYPGHYLQFLYAKSYPSDVRRVFSANSNSEGWAHYVEQVMVEEGFRADDPAYALAQRQDALLRDVRFIVGIKMHTQGMTIDEAAALFESQAHQPAPVARAEAIRGAGDPLYGYYTMGKLAILKLRNDYRALKGNAYTLKDFHDTFIRLGPLPLPLVRQAMLGQRGQLF